MSLDYDWAKANFPDYLRYACGLSLAGLSRRIREWRERKGFVTDASNLPEKLMLTVTELAEAMEDYRSEKMVTVIENGKPVGFASEIADVIIRLLDISDSLNIDIEHEIALKMAYNETRPHKHGRKC
jgi:NTP pyrophosphatase (non-canonical NTP hydrolase)